MGNIGSDADPHTRLALRDLTNYRVSSDFCVRHDASPLPTSYILQASDTSSRTIAHFRGDMPELGADRFQRHISVDILPSLAWIHFEGRNVVELEKMICYVADARSAGHFRGRLSLEAEKYV